MACKGMISPIYACWQTLSLIRAVLPFSHVGSTPFHATIPENCRIFEITLLKIAIG